MSFVCLTFFCFFGVNQSVQPPSTDSRRFRERMKGAMKLRTSYTGLLLGAALLLSATAFAGEKESLETQRAMTVNGSPLSAGKYTVTWEGSGPSVELKFVKGKNVVATVPAQVINQKTVVNGGIVTKQENNSVVLTQIRPEGKKYVLSIGGDVVQTAAENGSK